MNYLGIMAARQVSAGGKPKDALSTEKLVDLLIERARDAECAVLRGVGDDAEKTHMLLDETRLALLERVSGSPQPAPEEVA